MASTELALWNSWGARPCGLLEELSSGPRVPPLLTAPCLPPLSLGCWGRLSVQPRSCLLVRWRERPSKK